MNDDDSESRADRRRARPNSTSDTWNSQLTMRLLIKNGYIIDPAQGTNTGKSLFIEDGRVVGLTSHSDPTPGRR